MVARTRPEMELELAFPNLTYRAGLAPVGEHLAFTHEETNQGWVGNGHHESGLTVEEKTDSDPTARFLRDAMSDWRVFHFQDTTIDAGMRQSWPARDNVQLHSSGRNIAPFLRFVKERHPDSYRQILAAVRRAAPFIDDLLYREDVGERVALEWLERDIEPGILGPRQLSDGTIRFICLATLLLQPVQMQPSTILIDEPELGLHPAAISVLAAHLDRASEERQVIVSTQSVDLLSEMQPDHVVVVERCDGASVFRRPDWDELSEWLEDHSLGELWLMNTLGGRP